MYSVLVPRESDNNSVLGALSGAWGRDYALSDLEIMLPLPSTETAKSWQGIGSRRET